MNLENDLEKRREIIHCGIFQEKNEHGKMIEFFLIVNQLSSSKIKRSSSGTDTDTYFTKSTIPLSGWKTKL